METDQVTSESELHSVMKNIDSEISRLQTLIAGEDDKMLRYKVSFEVWLTCARLSDGTDVVQKKWGESKTQLIWEKGRLATSWPLILKFLKVSEASFNAWGHAQTRSDRASDYV